MENSHYIQPNPQIRYNFTASTQSSSVEMEEEEIEEIDQSDDDSAEITKQIEILGQSCNSSFLGRLISRDKVLLINQNVVEIGRNSTKQMVDFHVGESHFVSRKHLILHYDGEQFNLNVNSKNGIFLNGTFHERNSSAESPYKLPNS